LTASVERTHSFHPHCPRRSNHSIKHTFILLGYATNNYLLDNISTLLKAYFCLLQGISEFKTYAGDSIAAGMVTHASQILSKFPDKEKYPSPPDQRWGVTP